MVVARVPTLVVGNKTLSPAQVVLPVEITVGRENPTAQPNANALSFSYLGTLPPQFVRGAPVSATLLGYEEPGWSDIWDDLWSHEEPTKGVLPEPTPEGFDQWGRFWGWALRTEQEVRRNRMIYPAFRLGTGNNVTVRTNLAVNPSGEGDNGWYSNNGANYPAEWDTAVKHSGTRSRKSVPTQAQIDSGSRTILSLYNVGGGTFPVTVGRSYRLSNYVTHNAAVPGESNIGYAWLDSAGAIIGSTVYSAMVPVPANEWVRVDIQTSAAPTGAVTGRIISVVNRATGQPGIVAGEWAWCDDCLIEDSHALHDYFDGASASDADIAEGLVPNWSGPVNNSNSILVAEAAGVTGWTFSGGSLYRRPDGAVRFLSKNSGGAIVYNSTALVASPADTWSAAAKVVGAGGQVRIEVDTYNQPGANTKVNPGAYVACSDAGVRPIVQNITGDLLPADTTGVRPILRFDKAGFTYTLADVIAEKAASVGTYFDGSTPDTEWNLFGWAGQPDASESTQTAVDLDETGVVGSYEDGGATLVTDFRQSTYKGDVVWQGLSFALNTATDRTVRAYASIEPTDDRVWCRWELLWSPSNPNPDYFGSDTYIVGQPAVEHAEGERTYQSCEFTVPDEAQYARLGIRINPVTPATWDELTGTWDELTGTWDGLAGTLLHPVVRMREWNARVGKQEYDERVRFRGNITDLSASVGGNILQTQVQCIGRLSLFGDRYVGDVPWPVETDAARAQRISDLLPDQFIPNGSVQVSLNPRDVDRRKAADVLRDQAGSTGALLWEAPDGSVRYDSSESRGLGEGTPPLLAGSEIIADAEWRQEMSRFIPRVLVEYGVDPGEGADRPVYAAGDPALPESKINTDLSDLASATLVGDLIIRRWGDPTIWDAPRVHTTTEILTQGSYEALLATLPGDVIETDMMSDSPVVAGVVGRWFVEGWTESWDRPGADLVHDLNLGVSDYRRFTLAGEPAGLVLTAPTSWVFDGPDQMVTATMDVGVGAGTVTLYCEGRQVGVPTVPVGGEVTWMVNATRVPVGERVLEAKFSGVFAYWQADSAFANVVVTPSVDVAVAFTVTPTAIKVGSNATLAVTVTGPDGRPGRGKATWAYTTDGGTSWKDWYTDVLVAGTVRRTWKSNTPTANWAWRVRYTPDPGQGHAVSTSPPVPIDVLTQTTKTLTYNGAWQAVYEGTGAERAGVVQLVQGRHSSGTYGDQRSIAGFAIPLTDWQGWTITKVEVYLYFASWGQGTGTAIITSHAYDAKPVSNPVVTRRQLVAKWGTRVGKWVDVTGWGKGLATGLIKGVGVGPANSTSTLYYGVTDGVSQTNKPKVRITGSRWV